MLHRTIATNKIQRGGVTHLLLLFKMYIFLFCVCAKQVSLFAVVGKVLVKLGFMFSKTVFVFSCRYRQDGHTHYMMASFLAGQARLAILKCHEAKDEGSRHDLWWKQQ